MPIYVFKCKECGHVVERLQKINDNAPKCGCNEQHMEKQITADWKFTFTNGKGTTGGHTLR